MNNHKKKVYLSWASPTFIYRLNDLYYRRGMLYVATQNKGVLAYDKNLRIYFFSKNGVLLGGENFDKTPKLVDMVEKNTVKEYGIP